MHELQYACRTRDLKSSVSVDLPHLKQQTQDDEDEDEDEEFTKTDKVQLEPAYSRSALRYRFCAIVRFEFYRQFEYDLLLVTENVEARKLIVTAKARKS